MRHFTAVGRTGCPSSSDRSKLWSWLCCSVSLLGFLSSNLALFLGLRNVPEEYIFSTARDSFCVLNVDFFLTFTYPTSDSMSLCGRFVGISEQIQQWLLGTQSPPLTLHKDFQQSDFSTWLRKSSKSYLDPLFSDTLYSVSWQLCLQQPSRIQPLLIIFTTSILIQVFNTPTWIIAKQLSYGFSHLHSCL